MTKVIGFTVAYNEGHLVDAVMSYVEMLGYDKFVVYDNQSTDDTVEKLSKYPFVEIREWDTGGVFDDLGKRDLEIKSFVECKDLIEKTGDDVWMTFTDFDEVLFYFYENPFKHILDAAKARGCNCFYKEMTQIILPKNYEKAQVDAFINDGNLPHEYEGVRVNFQYSKPFLFYVNDFSNLYFVPGNHYALSEEDNVKNIEHFPIVAFHLKYYFHDLGLKKNMEYVKRKQTCPTLYGEMNELTLKRILGGTFPISIYFERVWRDIQLDESVYNSDFWGKLVFKEKYYTK